MNFTDDELNIIESALYYAISNGYGNILQLTKVCEKIRSRKQYNFEKL